MSQASAAEPLDAVDFGYSDSAVEAVLAAGVVDSRFDPEQLEPAVRRVVAGWLVAVGSGDDAALAAVATPAAVDALLHHADGTTDGRLVVRNPRARWVRITNLDAQATPPELAVNVLVAGRRWVEAGDSTEVLSGERDTDGERGDDEYWNFSENWRLVLDPAGRWLLASGTTERHEDIFGYRFVGRLETAEEYGERTGWPPPATSPATRRFLISADFNDDSVKFGGSTSQVFELDTAPARERSRELLLPAMIEEIHRTRGEGEFQPMLQRLEARELLD